MSKVAYTITSRYAIHMDYSRQWRQPEDDIWAEGIEDYVAAERKARELAISRNCLNDIEVTNDYVEYRVFEVWGYAQDEDGEWYTCDTSGRESDEPVCVYDQLYDLCPTLREAIEWADRKEWGYCDAICCKSIDLDCDEDTGVCLTDIYGFWPHRLQVLRHEGSGIAKLPMDYKATACATFDEALGGEWFDAFDALKRGDADGYVMARTVSALVC